jgi:hypothetical protein
MTSPATLNALYDNRSDPLCRRALDDYSAEHGYQQARLGVALWIAADAAAVAADADDADAAAAAAAADAAAADDADAAVADAAVADDDADAAVADAAVADAVRILHSLLTKEIDMRNGLKVFQLPGRYGYSVTLVGWFRRVAGDEYEAHNVCTIARTGSYALDGLQKLASAGPGKRGYDVTKAADMPEEIHRLLLRRVLPANEAAWREHSPKPKGWVEE